MNDKRCGSIKLIIGCMFSGKTSELQTEFAEWSSIGKKPICINYIDDNRYGNIYSNMYNHNENAVECLKTALLKDVDEEIIKSGEIILINEGQFFPDIVEYTLRWCEVYNKNVIVCGLDGDYLRKPFGRLLELIPYADSILKKTAYCKKCSDGTPGLFTHRKSQEKEQIVIGAADYEALCRACYLELTIESKELNEESAK
jgi:thymidine kinase